MTMVMMMMMMRMQLLRKDEIVKKLFSSSGYIADESL